jgi:glyoxylate reductase
VKRAGGFDMGVLYSDIQRMDEAEQALAADGVDISYVARDEVLANSDFVSVHTPLFDATHHLIFEDELQQMNESAVFVNTSRGLVVDPDALDTALEQGLIERAGLDVTEPEPLRANPPLLGHSPEKLVVTLLIASASIQTRNRMSEMSVKNILAGVKDEELPTSALRDAEMA